MRLLLNLRDERGDQFRVVTLEIQGEKLDGLTQEILWDAYQDMHTALEKAFNDPANQKP